MAGPEAGWSLAGGPWDKVHLSEHCRECNSPRALAVMLRGLPVPCSGENVADPRQFDSFLQFVLSYFTTTAQSLRLQTHLGGFEDRTGG